MNAVQDTSQSLGTAASTKAASTKGGGLRPPPLWIPLYGSLHGHELLGQVFHIFITPMCDFSYGFPHGPGAGTIELPLGTI